ncbi:MAG: nucleotidyltransferase family protein [Candidatus Latescibacterota bacterium]
MSAQASVTTQSLTMDWARTLSREQEVVVLCAGHRLEGERTERAAHLLAGELDWGEVIRWAGHHGVLVHVHRQVSTTPAAVAPQPVRHLLRAHYERNAVRNLHLTGVLLELLQVLEEEGIPALPYKGPVMALQLYGDPALRAIGDLDILVPPHQARPAREAVAVRGYVPEPHLSGPKAGSEYSYRLVHPARGVAVEVHWSVTLGVFASPFGLQEVSRRLGQVRLAGRPTPCMAPEDLVLALCLHLAKHCWEERLRLSWIADIARTVALDDGLDWEGLVRRAAEGGCLRMLLLGLRLAHRVCGCPLPAPVSARLEGEPAVDRLAARVWQWAFAPPAGSAQFGLSTLVARTEIYFAMRERRQHRLRYCAYYLGYAVRWSLTPNAEDRARLPLPACLDLVHYGLRPLRLAWKHAGRAGECLGHLRRLAGPLLGLGTRRRGGPRSLGVAGGCRAV